MTTWLRSLHLDRGGRSRIGRSVLAVTLVAASSLTGLVTTAAGTASAAPDASCLELVARGGTCQLTNAGDNVLTVPASLTEVTIVAGGASGASQHTTKGGRGGLVVAELRIAPSEQLNVIIGTMGNGTTPGTGFRSGGSGESSTLTEDSGGGGGATAVVVVGDEANPRVVAGGGGGAGGSFNTLAHGGWGGDGGLRASEGRSGFSPPEGGFDKYTGKASFGAAGGCTDGASSCPLAGHSPSDTTGGNGDAGAGDFASGGGGGGGFPASGWGGGDATFDPLADFDPAGGGGGGGGQSYIDPDLAQLLTSGTAEGMRDGFVTILPGGDVNKVTCTGPNSSQDYTVGVETNTVVALVAGGRSGQPTNYNDTGLPGRGALAIGTLAVDPGDTLTLTPGCEGYGSSVSPGAATGGAGGHAISSLLDDGDDGGGGAAASAVYDSAGTALLTSGGGGGSGGYNINRTEKAPGDVSKGGGGGDAGLGWGPANAGSGGSTSSSGGGGKGGGAGGQSGSSAPIKADGDNGSDGDSSVFVGGGGGGGGGGGVFGGAGGGTEGGIAGGGGGAGSSGFDSSVQNAVIGTVAPGADNGFPTDDGYIILIPISPPTSLTVQVDKQDNTPDQNPGGNLAVDVVCVDTSGTVVYNTTASGLQYNTPQLLTTELSAGVNCAVTQRDSELGAAWTYEVAQAPPSNVLRPGDNLYRLVDRIDQVPSLTVTVNNAFAQFGSVLTMNVSCERNGVPQDVASYSSTDITGLPVDDAVVANQDQSVTLRFPTATSTYRLNYSDSNSSYPLTGSSCTGSFPGVNPPEVYGSVSPAGTTFYRQNVDFTLSGLSDGSGAPPTVVTVDTLQPAPLAAPADPGPAASGTGTITVQTVNSGDGAAFANRAPLVTLSCAPVERGGDGYTTTLVMPAEGGSASVTDVPVGSACVVAEGAAAGATAVSYESTPVPAGGGSPAIVLATGVQLFVGDTPQTVTIGNRFDVGPLTVRLQRDGSAASAPHEATRAGIRCTFNGRPVAVPGVTGLDQAFDGPGEQVRTGAPIGAVCAATPITDAYTAVDVSPPAVVTADGAAVLTIRETYQAGTITVRVALAGPGAAAAAQASFDVLTRCVPSDTLGQSILPFDAGLVTVTGSGGFVSAAAAVPVGFVCGAALVNIPSDVTKVVDSRSETIVDGADRELLTTVYLGAATPTPPTPGSNTHPVLANTGLSVGPVGWTALVLLLVGGWLMLTGRARRRSGRTSDRA